MLYDSLFGNKPVALADSRTSVRHPLPDLRIVDWDRADDVAGLASLIGALAGRSGLFASATALQGQEAVQLTELARSWIRAVRPRMASMPPGDALVVADAYDWMHRIAWREPAESAGLERIRLAAFDVRMRGDETVDEYLLFRVIGTELDRRNPHFFGRPLAWHSTCLDRWYGNFRYGTSLAPLSDYDTLQQVGILLDEDLRAFDADPQGFKQALFAAHSHYLDESVGMDLSALEALAKFLSASIRFMPADARRLYDRLLTESVVSHPATNRFRRAAMEMSVASAS